MIKQLSLAGGEKSWEKQNPSDKRRSKVKDRLTSGNVEERTRTGITSNLATAFLSPGSPVRCKNIVNTSKTEETNLKFPDAPQLPKLQLITCNCALLSLTPPRIRRIRASG
ncbi:unnamed protein product [Pleuronectes platessa]|uniref:Uncharacterized protein n=1 Tax=Pleuronectes platessa TaxID=8262 RepID=A0A9N7VX87_PLEPL|nr:unnamed protein product [Pleuronectes platessa]